MEPDIFFTEPFARLFERTGFGGQFQHFEHGGISYNFYLRPIPGTEYFDTTSPYGYSGPVGNGDWPDYLIHFELWAKAHNIVSEFARLHPFEAQLENLIISQSGDVAYIDLTQSETQIRKGFDKGCLSSIKKAERSGVHIKAGLPYIAIFEELYTDTMLRNHAAEHYFFPHSFWMDAVTLLYPHLQLFTAWRFGQPLASALFLSYGDYCHYWFAGSNDGARETGANNLLLSEAIFWAKEQGHKIFNLGGGLGGQDDSLSSFKRSFTRTTKPFYTYRKIHLPEVYEQLSKGKPDTGFFPRYRA